MNEQKSNQDDKFRESLRDVGLVITKLSGTCTSFEEMLQVIELALQNDGQLKLLLQVIMDKRDGRSR